VGSRPRCVGTNTHQQKVPRHESARLTPEILTILTNREVIAIDQDPLGRQARRAKKDGDVEIWTRPLAARAQAVGVFNRGATTANVTIRCEDLRVCGYKIRDVWTHADAGTLAATQSVSVSVPGHGVVLWRLTPVN